MGGGVSFFYSFFFCGVGVASFFKGVSFPPFSILPPDGEREEEKKEEEEGKQQSGERRKKEKPIPDQPCRRPRMRGGGVGHSTNERSPA